MNQAKGDGSWYADREQIVELPKGRRLRRFWLFFGVVFVVLFVARVMLSHVLRHTGWFGESVWLEGLIGAFFPAIIGAALVAFPARRNRPKDAADRRHLP